MRWYVRGWNLKALPSDGETLAAAACAEWANQRGGAGAGGVLACYDGCHANVAAARRHAPAAAGLRCGGWARAAHNTTMLNTAYSEAGARAARAAEIDDDDAAACHSIPRSNERGIPFK